MKTTLTMIVLSAALIGGWAGAQARSRAAAECAQVLTGPEVEEIRRLEERGAAANVEGWTIQEARAFFAPEWASLQPDGSLVTVEAVFAGFRDGRSQPWAGSFTLTGLDIRVHCDTAIVFGQAEARAIGAPATSPATRFHFLNVWRKEEGRWLYAANQYVRD